MANFSDYLEQQLLGVTLLGSSFTAVTTTYLSLATSLADDGGTFTEVTTNLGYVRLPIEWSAPTSGPTWTVANSATVTFSPATTPWGTVTHFGVYDAETIGTGNLLYWGALDTPRAIGTNDVLEVTSGNLTVELD